MTTRDPETILALTTRIKNTLENTFSNVWVEGEISNFKMMSSGHAYFSLKDAGAQISCAFFSMARRSIPFEVKDGLKVRVTGDVTVYPPRGAYQLAVRSIEQAGIGDLMVRFEELKRRLKDEGLFSLDHKRPLPKLPRKIGIVTSPTGAAIRDMLNVTRRRFSNIHIVIAPARVQGNEAIPEIVAGIENLNAMPDPPDVIIVGRGGGSIEDLWCFNEEPVARAIYASKIPIISAVGHEIDFTIADFTADLRAPTPSAAAELVVGQKDALDAALATTHTRLNTAMFSALDRVRARIDLAANNHVFKQPTSILRQHTQHLDFLSQQLTHGLKSSVSMARERLTRATPRMTYKLTTAVTDARERLSASTPRMHRAYDRAVHDAKMCLHAFPPALFNASKNTVAESAHRLENLETRLSAMNPLAVLSRGYAIVKNADGKVIRKTSDVHAGETLITRLSDGEIHALAINAQAKPKKRATSRRTSPSPDQPTLL